MRRDVEKLRRIETVYKKNHQNYIFLFTRRSRSFAHFLSLPLSLSLSHSNSLNSCSREPRPATWLPRNHLAASRSETTRFSLWPPSPPSRRSLQTPFLGPRPSVRPHPRTRSRSCSRWMLHTRSRRVRSPGASLFGEPGSKRERRRRAGSARPRTGSPGSSTGRPRAGSIPLPPPPSRPRPAAVRRGRAGSGRGRAASGGAPA